jgi:hypothetical protein
MERTPWNWWSSRSSFETKEEKEHTNRIEQGVTTMYNHIPDKCTGREHKRRGETQAYFPNH